MSVSLIHWGWHHRAPLWRCPLYCVKMRHRCVCVCARAQQKWRMPLTSLFFVDTRAQYRCHNCVPTLTSELRQMAEPGGIWTPNPGVVNASFHPQSWTEPVCRAGSDAAVWECVCATSEPHGTDQWTSHCPSMVNNVLHSDRKKTSWADMVSSNFGFFFLFFLVFESASK